MELSPSDVIRKLQQELDRIDDNISYKKEVLLRGIGGDELRSCLRIDIRTLTADRKVISNKILQIKLLLDKQPV